MYRKDSGLKISPSDLTKFLDSPFASWMDRWAVERRWAEDNAPVAQLPQVLRPDDCVRDEADETMELIAGKGLEHEARFLGQLKSEGRGVVEIDNKSPAAAVRTLEAMREGAEVIFQARLGDGRLAGWADFLVRVPGASDLGDYHYEVWDTKLARETKAYYLVQLCAYAELLKHVQGRRPDELVVVLGTGEKRRFKTTDFLFYYRRLLESFDAFHEGFFASGQPHPADFVSHGDWSTYAGLILEDADHLGRVANITRSQILKLEAAGIATMSQLARTAASRVPKLDDGAFTRLKAQARLQIESVDRDQPAFEILPVDPTQPRRGLALLPSASEADVYFDIEGYPLVDGGLEYLLGAVCHDGNDWTFRAWWAHDDAQEKASFESFIDWATERWLADRSTRIYHYAAYEVGAMKRLMGKHDTREAQVDALLRNQVFVDLFAVVRQGMIVGTPSYSLKDIEHLYRPLRDGEVTTSMGSVVAYEQWLESGASEGEREPSILQQIADYNEVDCRSTLELAQWLRQKQRESGIGFHDVSAEITAADDEVIKVSPVADLHAELNRQADGQADPVCAERWRTLAGLLEFHWREAKPVFWRMFARSEMTHVELAEDIDCIGGLSRTGDTPEPVKSSLLYRYAFDPDQDTKLTTGKSCMVAHDLSLRFKLSEVDSDSGRVAIRRGKNRPAPPDFMSVIPDEYVNAKVIADSIEAYVRACLDGASLNRALDDLLARRAPRLTSDAPITVGPTDLDPVDYAVSVATHLDRSCLCIQGPPGTGKTYTAASIIAELMRAGKRVAVTAISHKAITNVLHATIDALDRVGVEGRLVKVGAASEGDLRGGRIEHLPTSRDAAGALATGALVMGGSAWVFSRPELRNEFDVLLIDEAGQFSLANVLGCGLCARNLLLVGDQMQLAQPIQGSHPGQSGLSGLEYLLDGRATIPDDFGVFLDVSRRMHPEICSLISDAIYDGRLRAHEDNSRFSVAGHDLGLPQAGVCMVDVAHEGNTQGSDEEVEAIAAIVERLVGRSFTGKDGKPRPLLAEDLMIVAPYNMQVRKIEARLGAEYRVGSVDRFQGQEAPVVIVSMCASSVSEAPRGCEFLLNPNRLNVAISRAQALAIVVRSPRLADVHCDKIEQMRLLNLWCRVEEGADRVSCPPLADSFESQTSP